MTPATAGAHTAEALLLAVEQAYDLLLGDCVDGFEETALQAAHELGREALGLGLGVLDLVELHHRLLAKYLATRTLDDSPETREAAGRLLVECLTPFEMVHRGFRTANAALKASEQRYRDLFENANDAIFTTDLSGRLTSINAAAERLTGYSRADAIALKLTSLITYDRNHAKGRGRLRVSLFDDARRYELEILTRDGRRIPVEVSTRRIYDAGRPIGLQGIARDITDRKHAESTQRYLNSRLEEKAKRIAHALHDEAGQLLASVYLRIAEIASELPSRDRGHVEELRTLLDQVDDQIRRLAHELRPGILDELGLVPACQLLAEGVSKRTGLRITVSGSTRGRLAAEIEIALYRVVQEALNNVMRHAHARTVTVKVDRVGHRLRGHVRDDGAGFDLATASRAGNHGLGLSGMRERLVAVSGRLDITSTPGSGTSVEFDLPLEG